MIMMMVSDNVIVKGAKTEFTLTLSVETIFILGSHVYTVRGFCVLDILPNLRQAGNKVIDRVRTKIAPLFYRVTLSVDYEVGIS